MAFLLTLLNKVSNTGFAWNQINAVHKSADMLNAFSMNESVANFFLGSTNPAFKQISKKDQREPEWIHEENFLAFRALGIFYFPDSESRSG